MSKLITALIAAGFGIGLNAAVAQNVDSDKEKARVQDQVMQDKEQSAKPSSSSQQQGQSNPNQQKNKADSGQAGAAQAGKMPQDCSKLSGKDQDKCLQATPAGTVDMSTGQGNKAKSETAKERDREKAESPAESAIPEQSKDTVGHPQERATTGEGQTLREPGTATSNSNNNTGAKSDKPAK